MEPHVTKLDYQTDPIRLKADLDNLLSNNGLVDDTLAFVEVNESLKGTYFEEIILHFSEYTRWRLLKLASRTNYSIHTDSTKNKENPRIHIPILTNPDAYLMFFDSETRNAERTQPDMFHLEVGKTYLLNAMNLHSAINFGNTDRYHIVGAKYEDKRFSDVVSSTSQGHY